MKVSVGPATGSAGPIRELNLTWLRDPSPTPKALLRVAQGWRCEASYPGFKSPYSATLKALLPIGPGQH